LVEPKAPDALNNGKGLIGTIRHAAAKSRRRTAGSAGRSKSPLNPL